MYTYTCAKGASSLGIGILIWLLFFMISRRCEFFDFQIDFWFSQLKAPLPIPIWNRTQHAPFDSGDRAHVCFMFSRNIYLQTLNTHTHTSVRVQTIRIPMPNNDRTKRKIWHCRDITHFWNMERECQLKYSFNAGIFLLHVSLGPGRFVRIHGFCWTTPNICICTAQTIHDSVRPFCSPSYQRQF